MARANFKPLDISDDEVLSRVQANIQQAFSNLDQTTGHSVKTVSSRYQVLPSDDVILTDASRGPFTVILPDPKILAHKSVSISKIGPSSNAVTVQPNSSKVTISGQSSLTLTTPIRLVSDGISTYWIIA